MNDLERNSRRIAAAFGVRTFERYENNTLRHNAAIPHIAVKGVHGETLVTWMLCISTGDLLNLKLYRDVEYWSMEREVDVSKKGFVCSHYAGVDLREEMARGLYCLGFEDEGVLAKLSHPLSAHEKLELRLGMAREFWPKIWRDETV